MSIQVDKKGNDSAYITIGNIILYVDDSTNEQIVHIWKENDEKTLHLSLTDPKTGKRHFYD